MGVYTINTRMDKGRVYQSTSQGQTINLENQRDKTYMNPGEVLLAALGACKCMSFYDLAQKYGMDIQQCQVEIHGVTGKGPLIEGTHIPSSRLLSVEYVYKIQSANSDEELENYMKYVDGACTVGNSLKDDILQSHRFERL